ncbi:MAG TPA: ribulose-phosphate 3-epimerase [Gemmatimonadetes bacterium]|jgi:ribulose-phosphate 3-epimerase|nr:ribulose-phosphate 3-epimerase [Gemmatimonadota bacterium]HIN51626.1 ribulose-phosphate 3-epimerase [Gemmatimonadota bacterium]
MKIAPSILSCDFSRLADEIQTVESGGADWIHVDVMDGHFVPNITIGPIITAGARKATDLPLDVHLMIEQPDRYLEAFVDAGADWLTVHAEACTHLHRTVQRIRELGARAGVAINPATPLASLTDVVPYIDLLLVMSVNPGFGGQSYISASTAKVRDARTLLDEMGSTAELEVDGGVDAGNVGELQAAGASVVVAGSAVYGHVDGAAAGVRLIRDALGRKP